MFLDEMAYNGSKRIKAFFVADGEFFDHSYLVSFAANFCTGSKKGI